MVYASSCIKIAKTGLVIFPVGLDLWQRNSADNGWCGFSLDIVASYGNQGESLGEIRNDENPLVQCVMERPSRGAGRHFNGRLTCLRSSRSPM